MSRSRVHQLLTVAAGGDRASRAVDLLLAVLILANVAALLAESCEPAETPTPWFYGAFEGFSVALFTLEYVLRLWSAPEDARYRDAGGRLRWARSPMALVDLAAILPAWLGLLVPVGLDLRVVRAVRLLRILRLGKLGRYSVAMQAVVQALRDKANELLSVVFVLAVMLVIASTLMFYVEHDANPGAFPSIPAAMWWGIATLTTVGYGDVVPITATGRILGACIAVLGIGVFALPAAILSGAFAERLRRPASARRCPHCGEPIDDPFA